MDTVFVGREPELQKAHELLEAARKGTESVLCLEGAPGMGKTTLSRRIVEVSRDAGLAVLKSAFVDGQDLPPLWPWRRILTKAARLTERALEVPTVHGRLLAHLDTDWEQVPGLSELPANQRKYRFFEWIAAFLHDLARSAPLAIVLEDLHNGDDASLHLLQYLVDALEYSAVFVVLTWRPNGVRGGSRIAELKEQLHFIEHSSDVVLEGFGRKELGHYLSDVSGSIAAEDIDQILAWTEGVPLRVFLYAERLAPELNRMADPPRSLSQLFWLGLSRELSDSTCRAVRQLALLGNAFTSDEIDAIGRGAGWGAGVKEELLHLRLIRSDEEGSYYRFFHDELRLAVVELLPETQREELVEQTAACIATLPEQENERRIRLLKELFLMAQSEKYAEPAVRYTLKAVDLAEGQNAWPEVISDLESLIAQHKGPLGPGTVRDLQLRLCRAYHRSFNEPAGVPLALELFDHFKARGDSERLIDLVLNFGFGWALGERNVFPDILALTESVPKEHPRRAALLAAVGTGFSSGLGPEKAVALSREALEIAQRRGELLVEISASVCLAISVTRLRRFEEAVSMVDDLLREHSVRIGAMELAFALLAKQLALLGLGRLEECYQVFQEMTKLNRLYDDPVMRVYLRFVADRNALKSGRWSHLRLDEPNGTENDFNLHLPAVTAAYLTGRSDAADRFVEQFVEITRPWAGGARNHDRMCACWLIALRAYLLSDTKWVDLCARHLPELFQAIGAVVGYLTDLPICAARIARLRPGTADAEHEYYDRLLEADAYFYEEEEYTIAAAKALLALQSEDHRRAARHFEEAIALCDKQRERPWRAYYLFELALLLAANEDERAQRLVDEAKSEGERLGLKPLLARIEQEWPCSQASATSFPASVSDRVDSTAVAEGREPPARAVNACGITRRERDVLNCLVEGLTDKEIAATLNISPYTVGNHLRNIYAKTMSANRGEAVHWALAHRVASVESTELPRTREVGR